MEEWRKVPGYHYSIDITGEEYKCRNDETGRIIKAVNSNGRLNWSLWINGKEKCKQIGVWIALTYPELIENEWFKGAEIDHKDTNVRNNHPSNLHWVTHKQNINNPHTLKNKSTSRVGKKHTEETKKKISKSLKGKFLNRTNQSKNIQQFSKNGDYIESYPSIAEAARQTNINRKSINACCTGKYKSAGGYIWKYE